MKIIRSKILLGILCFGFLSFTEHSDKKTFAIPARAIEGYRLMGDVSNHNVIHINDFEISSFVTYGEYKVYLKEVKKDSSRSFYKSQLPDTAMCLPDVYQKYVNSTECDNYPVMGISWEAAMNYCKWLTLKNNDGNITYIYRLPLTSEWIDAYDYLKSKSVTNDFNGDYSDWLFNAFDESFYDFKSSKACFENYFTKDEKHQPNVLRRKQVIGNSYLYSLNNLNDYLRMYCYAFHGYRQVGFRYVKCKAVNDSANMDEILYYWGMKKLSK